MARLRGQRVLNIADPDTPTVLDIASWITGMFGYRGQLVPLQSVDAYPPPVIGRTPWSVQRPFTLDTSMAAALGYRPVVTYCQTAEAVCRWLAETASDANWRQLLPVLASYPFDLFDYVAEDAASMAVPPSQPSTLEPCGCGGIGRSKRKSVLQSKIS